MRVKKNLFKENEFKIDIQKIIVDVMIREIEIGRACVETETKYTDGSQRWNIKKKHRNTVRSMK